MAKPRARDGAGSRPAIVEVLSDGERRGTGFFVADEIVLTCDHVVPPDGTLEVRLAGGEVRRAQVAPELSLPAMDVCVLRVSGAAPARLPVSMLPPEIHDAIWTNGFSGGGSITDALPSTGIVAGRTSTQYETRRSYDIHNVFRVRELRADFGASGAPVLAMPEEVAIGMTLAKYLAEDNLVLPFDVLEDTPLGAFLAERALPAFGRYLNAAGARELCVAERRAAIQRLVDRRQYLRDQYVTREPLESAIAAFLAQTEKSILPVAGSSGVGKSSALAHFVDRAARAFVVLLTGHRVDVKSGSLADAIETELRESSSKLFALDHLAHVARETGEPLVIVFDALNEVIGTAAQLRPWIERTLTWLESTGARLIVSSREDFWLAVRPLIPERLFASDPSSLHDFSFAEVRAAVAAYRLSPQLAEQPILRRPVFLRLYADLGATVMSGGVSHSRLLQAYIADRTQQTAIRLDPPVPASSIELLLERVAARADATLTIAKPNVFQEIEPEVVQALLSENLLLESDDGFRFLFDEVCEYLLSKVVELPPSVAAWVEWKPSWPLGAIRFAILRLEIDDTEAALHMLRGIAEKAAKSPYPFGIQWRNLLLDTFSRMATPPVELLLDSLRTAVPTIESYEQDAIVSAIEVAAIGVPERLKLLNTVAPAQNDYPWRESDWRPEASTPYHHGRYVLTLRRAFEENLHATIESLVGSWLGDNRPLREDTRESKSSTKVSNIAKALLYEQSVRYPDAICDALADRGDPVARNVLRMIANDHPKSIEGVLRRWAEEPTRARDNASTVVFHAMAVVSPWMGQRVRELAQSSDPQVSAEAGELLARIPSQAEGAFRTLVERYVAGDRAVRLDMLTSFAATASASYRAFVRLLLRTSNDESDLTSALLALPFREAAADEHESIVDLLEEVLDRPKLRYALGSALERELNAIDANSPAFSRLVDLARRFVTADGSGGRPGIFYFILDTQQGAKRDVQFMLTDAIIDSVRDVRDLKQFCELLGERYTGDRAMFARILRLADVIGDDRILLEGALQNEQFAMELVESDRSTQQLVQLRQLVAGGKNPKQAAADIAWRNL